MIRYDSDWHELSRVELDDKKLSIEHGDHALLFDCIFDKDDDTKVKIELRTVSGPDRITAPQD